MSTDPSSSKVALNTVSAEDGGDSLQALYDRKYGNEVWLPLRLRPSALSTNRYDDVARLLSGAGGRLLEVGCGSGRLTLALAPQFESAVGIDLSRVRIRLARDVL